MTKKEAFEEWIAALRSGKYEQGRSRLISRNGDKFCCLGVAVCVLDGREVLDDIEPDTSSPDRDWATEYAKLELNPFDEDLLARKNDGNNNENEMYDFDKIADYIEANLMPKE